MITLAAAVGRAPEGQLSATAIQQRWNHNAGQRVSTRNDDRTHQRAVEWWTKRQTTLPPRIADALHGHHYRVIAALASRGPQTWEQMVRAAASNTDWDERPASDSFIERLESISSRYVHGLPNMAMPSQVLMSRD